MVGLVGSVKVVPESGTKVSNDLIWRTTLIHPRKTCQKVAVPATYYSAFQ